MDTLIRRGRIVGLKYAKMKKQYRNTVFPFHQEGIPVHVLITLVNMGGKGVLLQAFFQLIEPLIRWGKEEKMVDSFFFKEKKMFSPYTFHVLIEWAVGKEPHTKITTGIAITANPKRSHKVGSESPIDPEYLLYIVEQTEDAPFDIASIPLWNEETQTSLSMEDLKKYLKRHEAYVSTYTKNQRREYFNELKKYGIDPHEWRVLKSINKDEGDVSAYFGRADDNHTLSSKVIIPGLDKQIEPEYKKSYRESKSLSETFKEVAITNQEMPNLIEREYTYKILIDELSPVITFLKNCAVLEQELLEHRKKGYIIKEYMKAKLNSKIVEDKDITKKLADIVQKLERLKWESSNLQYAKAFRNVTGLNDQIDSLREKQSTFKEMLEKEVKLAKVNRVNLRLVERAKLRNESEQKIKQYNRLKEMLKLDDLEGEMKKLKEKLKNVWDEIYVSWKGIRKQHSLFIGQCEKNLSINREKLCEHNEIIAQIGDNIIGLRIRLSIHQTQKAKLQAAYGEIITDDPENFNNIYEFKLKSIEEEAKKIKEEQLQIRKEQESLLTQKVEKLSQICSFEEKKAEIKEKLDIRLCEESKMMDKISNTIKERIDTYSKEAILSAIKKLEKEFSLIQISIDSKIKERWILESQYDILKNSNYWIPNKDVLEVKNEIASQGIACELGMEILYQMIENVGEDVARKEIEKSPLFPYGVVVSSEDVEDIDLSFLERKFQQSPVPIFIREHMQKSHTSKQDNERLYPTQNGMFITIDAWLHQALDLYAFEQKKKEMDRKGDDFEFLIDQEKGHLQKIQKLLHFCESFVEEPDSSALCHKKAEIEKDLHTFHELMSAIEEQLSVIAIQSKVYEDRLSEIDLETHEYKRKIEEVKQWMSEEEEHKRISLELEGFIKDRDKEIEKKEVLERIIKNKEKELKSYRETYQDWKRDAKEQYKRLTTIFDWVRDPLEQPLQYSQVSDKVEAPVYSAEGIDQLKNYLFEHSSQKNSIEVKNLELTKLSFEIDSLSEKITDVQTELFELNPNWESLQVPSSSKNIIVQYIQTHEDNAEDYQKKINILNEETLRLSGSLDRDKVMLEAEKKRVEKLELGEPDSWMNVDLVEKEKEIKRNRQQLNAQKQEVDLHHEKILNVIQSLTNNIAQLDSSDILETKFGDFADIDWLQGIKGNFEQKTASWTGEYFSYMNKLKESGAHFKALYEGYRSSVGKSKDLDKDVVASVEAYFEDIITQEYSLMYEGVRSVLVSFEEELQRISEDKIQGLKVIKQWTDRATYRVNLIVKKMKQMVSRMKIKNHNDYIFPLVKYANNYQFNENLDYYNTVLTEFFIKILAQLKQEEKDIQDIPLYEIDKMIDISILVLKVLGNQYPTLEIYNPGGDNHLLYGKPNDSLYSDWETIMKGDYAEASGSGGQKLMTQMIIMAMLMKSNKKGWSVLISDNPFSKMVSEHVIAPIFALCELLKIQWVVVSPPELTSTVELTKRFPIIHRLSFTKEKGKDIIDHAIQMNSRIYIDKENILNEQKVSSE
ncbi:hypothetical protein [Bacillus sp. S14(2024)]|uniref:hypothetical protein n=1 Tax=Bacillus sp. S14(2024) TaxID=3162884 RepID=UPI003D223F24